jgi:hypothetical protein
LSQDFLLKNGLQMIIRSHEVRAQGYSVEQGGKLVCILTSAPSPPTSPLHLFLYRSFFSPFFLFLFLHLPFQITLFSAPSYMGDSNKGAYLRLSGTDLEIRPFQFTAVPTPASKVYYDGPQCNLN